MGRLGIAVCLGALGLGLVVSASKGRLCHCSLRWRSRMASRAAAHGRRGWRCWCCCAAGVVGYLMSPLKQVLSYRLAEGALEYSAGERMDLYGLA